MITIFGRRNIHENQQHSPGFDVELLQDLSKHIKEDNALHVATNWVNLWGDAKGLSATELRLPQDTKKDTKKDATGLCQGLCQGLVEVGNPWPDDSQFLRSEEDFQDALLCDQSEDSLLPSAPIATTMITA